MDRASSSTPYILAAFGSVAAILSTPRHGWAADRSEEEKLWAFQRPRQHDAPAVRGRHWVRNPIDSFILVRLEAAGLTPAAR